MNNIRFLNELNRIYRLPKNIKSVILSKDPNNFSIKLKIPINSSKFIFAKIIFPPEYPFLSPEIWFYDDSDLTYVSDFQWTTHQNSDGSMCLFTGDFGLGSWHYKTTISDIIDKIQVFIGKCQNKTISDDHTSIFHPLPGRLEKSIVFLCISTLKDIITNQSIFDDLYLYEFNDGRPSFILYTQNNLDSFRTSVWKKQLSPIPIGKGCSFKLDFKMINFRNKIVETNNPEEIFKTLNSNFTSLNPYDFIVPIFKDTHITKEKVFSPTKFRTHISYLYDFRDNYSVNINHIPLHQVYGVNLQNDIFQRTYGIFKQDINLINEKKVMIIGLGTLGSYISLELAKTGIYHFILIDYDIVQPVNISRHLAFIDDIGKYKTKVIQDQINRTNPNAIVQVLSLNPFTTANLMKFRRLIRDVDLILMTTANHNASILLNKIAIEEGKIVIYSECGPDAKIGRIYRVIPRKTPCYMCINSKIFHDDFYFRIKPDSDEFITQFAGYNQPGIPGISIDINFIALFTARFAIQTLLLKNKNKFKSQCNHYLWQNYKTEANPYRDIDLIPQGEFSRELDCDFCGGKTSYLNRSTSSHTQVKIDKLVKILSAGKRKRDIEQ